MLWQRRAVPLGQTGSPDHEGDQREKGAEGYHRCQEDDAKLGWHLAFAAQCSPSSHCSAGATYRCELFTSCAGDAGMAAPGMKVGAGGVGDALGGVSSPNVSAWLVSVLLG